MPWLFTLFLFAPVLALAQPGPPSFCFVLAEDRGALRPLQREAQVLQRYCERVPYVGFSGTWLKPEETLPLQGGRYFRDSTEGWVWYRPSEGMAESYLLIVTGADTMRIELPEDQNQLWQNAMARGGSRDSPDVIRFRTGQYRMEELIMDPWAMRAAVRLDEQWVKEDRMLYKRELAAQEKLQREQARAKAAAGPPAPPPTAEEIEREIAQRPGLEKVNIVWQRDDTLWVEVTGRVMLDGGCASGMPFFGIELFTDSGWVERLLIGDAQMDCGLPWADWQARTVMLPPLRWWTAARSPAARKDLKAGTYRLVLMGANMRRMHTEAFGLQ